MKRKLTPVTIELNDNELKMMQELANKKGMSLESSLKQAMRVYQTLEVRLEKGLVTREEFGDIMGANKGLCLAHEEG